MISVVYYFYNKLSINLLCEYLLPKKDRKTTKAAPGGTKLEHVIFEHFTLF